MFDTKLSERSNVSDACSYSLLFAECENTHRLFHLILRLFLYLLLNLIRQIALTSTKIRGTATYAVECSPQNNTSKAMDSGL